jgi:hypothetical protein
MGIFSLTFQNLSNLTRQVSGRKGLGEKVGACFRDSLMHNGIFCVARDERNLNSRARLADVPSELLAAHFGHHDIGDNQVDGPSVLFS